MAFTTHFRQAERLADVIGFQATMHMVGFFGRSGSRVYVPVSTDGEHILKHVIGAEAFSALVAEFGGQYLAVPECDLRPLRMAGMAYRLLRKGLAVADVASLLEINRRTVSSLKKELRLEGLPAVADLLPDALADESEAERV